MCTASVHGGQGAHTRFASLPICNFGSHGETIAEEQNLTYFFTLLPAEENQLFLLPSSILIVCLPLLFLASLKIVQRTF
jgi:hypothetical protein